jgi:hypothetical protein
MLKKANFDDSLPIGRKPKEQFVKLLTTLPQTSEIPEPIFFAAPKTVLKPTYPAKQVRFADPILKLYLITQN